MHGLAHNAYGRGILRPEQTRQFDRSGDVAFSVAGFEEGLAKPV